MSATSCPRVGFVVHVMNVAGAEMLVCEIIRQLQGRIDPVIFCLDDVGVLGERMRHEGVRVMAFGRKPGLDIGVAWRMARAIRDERIDVLHAHQYTPFFYSAIAAMISARRPRVIFTEHGRHYPDVVSARRRLANRLLLDRLADRINAVCAFSARSLSEMDGFRAGRIEVIQNGITIDPEPARADSAGLRQRLGLDPERRYIACVARFHPVKDHRTLLRAFRHVALSRPDVDLLLVGDGPLRESLVQLAAELEITDRVRMMGVRGDVPDILRAIDVFALTSLSEASSITLLEAMASETPVVVSDVGGNPELVRNGVEGLLVPRQDEAATADALLRILDDPRMAESMGHAGAIRVRRLHRLERTVHRYYELYAGAGRAA